MQVQNIQLGSLNPLQNPAVKGLAAFNSSEYVAFSLPSE
jgi:hypothetical protein